MPFSAKFFHKYKTNSGYQKRFNVTIDGKLSLKEHVSNLWVKASRII